jgi:hypothetical protein
MSKNVITFTVETKETKTQGHKGLEPLALLNY